MNSKALARKVKPRYLLLAALAVAGFLVFRRVGGGQAPEPTEEGADGGFGAAGAGDFSSIAGPYGGSQAAGDYSDTGTAVPSDLASLIAQIQDEQKALGARVGDFAGHVTEIEDALKESGWTVNEDKTWSTPGYDYPTEGYDDGPGEETGEPETPPVSGPSVAAQPGGVHWGGQTFKSKRTLGQWLAAHGAYGKGNANAAYREWAKRHPTAAGTLAGPPPAAPKPAPARPGAAPKKPPKKPPKKKRKPPKRPPPRQGGSTPPARPAPPKAPPTRPARATSAAVAAARRAFAGGGGGPLRTQ